MAQDENRVGQIPEFTDDASTPEPGPEEQLIEATPPVEEGTDNPEPPVEKPADLPVSVDNNVPSQTVDNPDLARAVNGLQEERVKLLKEISELRGQKREIAQENLKKVEQQIDDLKDLHPEDVTVIERVLRAKGLVTKEEANQMFYDSVKQDELNRFLEKHPEYRPENDPNDVNWSTLTRELGIYRIPANPHAWAELLDRAHRSIVRVPVAASKPAVNVEANKRRIEVASHGGNNGSSASKAPSNSKGFTPEQRVMYRQGGWSEEEISQMESRLE